jgi:beta-N-acetylhexosaminidase
MRNRRPPSTGVLIKLVALVGVLLFGLRAVQGSLSFMLPGGAIVGWSNMLTPHCMVCSSPTATTSIPAHHILTPETYAAMLTSQLSLNAKLGQLLVVQFQGTGASPSIVQMIANQDVGGVIFYAANIESAPQVRGLTGELQHQAPIPLLLAIDQEGGPVNRLLRVLGPLPAAADIADPTQAERRGQQDAGYLHDFGFNLNLAPVVDVGTANPQLWDRTFGSNPQRVAAMAGAYLEGLQETGSVAGTLKHFPGLGSTTTDPHVGLPVLTRRVTDWERIDLAPYRELLSSQQVKAIMVTHVLIPAVDPSLPASLSPTLITGVLRQQLGFEGVVITDDLTMGALSSRWSLQQAAVLAIKAGADVVTGAADAAMVEQITGALKQALADGTLSEARIDQAVEHVLELKLQLHLISMPASVPSAAQSRADPESSAAAGRTALSAELSHGSGLVAESSFLRRQSSPERLTMRAAAVFGDRGAPVPRAPP